MIIQTTKPLRPRDPDDHYPTPPGLALAALRLFPFQPKTILDPGAGTGVWGSVARELWPGAFICGVDNTFPDKPPAYDLWRVHDYLSDEAAVYSGADLVVGNPPYRSAEEFVRQALRDVMPSGMIIFLLRLAFLEGQARMAGLWREWPPTSVHVLGKRPSFTGDGKTDATAYAVYVWRKSAGLPNWKTTLDWLDWKDEEV